MGIATLPTKTDDSIGREKTTPSSDGFEQTFDPRSEVSPTEHNRRTDLMIEIATAVGLEDGSTPGSIEARLGGASSWRFFDDFHDDPSSNVRWALVAGGAGSTIQVIAASAAPASVEGMGWCELTSGGDPGSSPAIRTVEAIFRRGQGPIFEARVKLPATLANAAFVAGLQFGTDPTYALITTKDNGKWEVLIGSDGIPGTDSLELTTPVPAGGGIYTVRIELLAAEATARFYIDDVLVATLNTDTPLTTEALHAVVRCQRKAAGGGSVFVDYVDIRGAR